MKWGEAHCANNKDEAIPYLDLKPVDVLIIDLLFPSIVDCSDVLQHRHPDVKVIILTPLTIENTNQIIEEELWQPIYELNVIQIPFTIEDLDAILH